MDLNIGCLFFLVFLVNVFGLVVFIWEYYIGLLRILFEEFFVDFLSCKGFLLGGMLILIAFFFCLLMWRFGELGFLVGINVFFEMGWMGE